MDRLPRRRQRSTLGGALIQKLEEQRESKGVGTPTSSGRPPSKRCVVPCSRHEERDLGAIPCLLSSSLRDEVSANALLRVRSRQQPDLRFYARAHPGNFVQSVKGISILRAIAEEAKIGDKEVELQEVSEEEARLEEAVMVVGDCYMSNRDLWHMHLAMMQEGGQLLYRGFERNLWPHSPRSRAERLVAGGGEQLCGLVGPSTEVAFKSGSANLFVLVQVSAELFTFGLAGRPYWEVLLECFAQLLERGLKVQGSETTGHYVHMVLFARARRRPPVGDKTGHAKPLRIDSTASTSLAGELQDFYDVFWEGFAKALPPPQQLLARVRQVCAGLHERSWGWCSDGDASDSRDAWRCIDPGSLAEASRGNVLECLNLVLDSFDQHHLDRMLRVSGQTVLLLTAGSGLLHAASRGLFELTHQRFVAAGFQRGVHMVCVREPPLHAVPWVQWPGGPAPFEREQDDLGAAANSLLTSAYELTVASCASLGAGCSTLPPQPPWLSLVYHREVSFCPCLVGTMWMGSSFLPLERLLARRGEPLHVPQWTEAQRRLQRIRVSSGGSGFSSEAPLRDAVSEASGQWPSTPSPMTPPVRSRAQEPRCWSDQLWATVRLPRLRSYFNGAWTADPHKKANMYQIEASRFTGGDWDAINLMSDLVGLRLAAVGSAQLCRLDGAAPLWAPRGALGGTRAAKPIEDPWAMQANLIPETLHCLVVRSESGMQWTFEPCEARLHIFHNTGGDKCKVGELAHRYSGFFVRHHQVRKEEGEDPSPSSSLGCRGAWIPSRRVFHLQEDLHWNDLDTIIAGQFKMPQALPYPVERHSAEALSDRCPGWRLRGALKQHLFVLVPRDDEERSHRELFRCTREILGDEIDVGVDPFEVVEDEKGIVFCRGRDSEVRERTLKNFAAFKLGLEELCSGKAKSRVPFGISLDVHATSFEVKRGESTVYVRDVNIASAFPHSRDWFTLFYDSTYSPPKCFHLVLQWIACSSVHITNLLAKLVRLAEDSGFALVRLPIAQLFPQPAPHWVWGEDQETNFDRLVLYPRRKLKLPACGGEAGRRKLYCQLLQRWVEALGFLFIFSSPIQDFSAVPVLDFQHRQRCKVFQRLKGWVLCDPEGLCLIALRKDAIHWHESWLLHTEVRDWRTADQRLLKVERLRSDFFAETEELLASAAAATADGQDAAPASTLPCHPETGAGNDGGQAPPPSSNGSAPSGSLAGSPTAAAADAKQCAHPVATQRCSPPARDAAEGT